MIDYDVRRDYISYLFKKIENNNELSSLREDLISLDIYSDDFENSSNFIIDKYVNNFKYKNICNFKYYEIKFSMPFFYRSLSDIELSKSKVFELLDGVKFYIFNDYAGDKYKSSKYNYIKYEYNNNVHFMTINASKVDLQCYDYKHIDEFIKNKVINFYKDNWIYIQEFYINDKSFEDIKDNFKIN